MRPKHITRAVLITGVAALLLVGGSAAGTSRTLTVCPQGPPVCQYSRIQAALDAARNGDLIAIARGSYLGPIVIAKSVNLTGSGVNETTIKAAPTPAPWTPERSIVTVSANVSVILSRVTVTGASFTPYQGAGITNNGTLIIEDSAISGNGGGRTHAGGIYNMGALTLSRSTVSHNAGDIAGGIDSAAHSTLVVQESTLMGNSGDFGGGAIANEGTAEISDSNITANYSLYESSGIENRGGVLTVTTSSVEDGVTPEGWGAGISNYSGTATVTDSTISSNTGGRGGGIYNGGWLILRGSTVNGNLTNYSTGGASGGGISNWGTARVFDSTISGNGGWAFGSGWSSAGGFDNYGTAELYRVNISGNDARAQGGGIRNDDNGTMSLVDSKVTGNTAHDLNARGIFGGGIYNVGNLTLTQTPVSGNTPDDCVGCPNRRAVLDPLGSLTRR